MTDREKLVELLGKQKTSFGVAEKKAMEQNSLQNIL